MASKTPDPAEEEMKIVGCLTLALLSPGIIVLPTLYESIVAGYLWGWFVTPAFSVPCPKLSLLMGLILIVNLLTFRLPRRWETAEEEKVTFRWYQQMARTGLVITIIWGVGYVVHLLETCTPY